MRQSRSILKWGLGLGGACLLIFFVILLVTNSWVFKQKSVLNSTGNFTSAGVVPTQQPKVSEFWRFIAIVVGIIAAVALVIWWYGWTHRSAASDVKHFENARPMKAAMERLLVTDHVLPGTVWDKGKVVQADPGCLEWLHQKHHFKENMKYVDLKVTLKKTLSPAMLGTHIYTVPLSSPIDVLQESFDFAHRSRSFRLNRQWRVFPLTQEISEDARLMDNMIDLYSGVPPEAGEQAALMNMMVKKRAMSNVNAHVERKEAMEDLAEEKKEGEVVP